MAEKTTEGASAPKLTKPFTVENTGRRRLHFPRLDDSTLESVIIGDSEDRDSAVHIRRDGRNPQLCPHPVRKVTPEEWEGIGPMGREAMTSLVEQGILKSSDGPFRVREAA